jgi:hypothetical protein
MIPFSGPLLRCDQSGTVHRVEIAEYEVTAILGVLRCVDIDGETPLTKRLVPAPSIFSFSSDVAGCVSDQSLSGTH